MEFAVVVVRMAESWTDLAGQADQTDERPEGVTLPATEGEDGNPNGGDVAGQFPARADVTDDVPEHLGWDVAQQQDQLALGSADAEPVPAVEVHGRACGHICRHSLVSQR